MTEVRSLPLSAVRESPFNPRKTYGEAALQELADSIRTQGVMQPVVARPLGDLQTDIEVRYELVFGHRRFRAAALAGLEFIPAILREMSDADAAIAQVHENLQRADVTPLEEADSFQRLRTEHEMKPEQIAAAIGKSKAYVYARLKLATGAPEIRAAMTEQGLSPEIGLKIARLPHHNLQREALKQLRETYSQTAETPIVWCSTRSADARISGMFRIDLNDAPFDLADAKLVKSAGACTTCSRRAGNVPELEGVLAPSICTYSNCYESKVDARRAVELVNLRTAGHKVVTGKDAEELRPNTWMDPTGYMGVERVIGNIAGETITIAQAIERLGDNAPKLLILPGARDDMVDRYVHHTELAALRDAVGIKAPAPSAAGASASEAWDRTFGRDDRSSWTPAELVAADARAWPRVYAAVISAVPGFARTTDELRLILEEEHEAIGDLPGAGAILGLAQARDAAHDAAGGDEFNERAWYSGWLAAASADDLASLVVASALDMAINRPAWNREKAARHVAIAERYVDVLATARTGEESDEAGSAGDDETDEPADAGDRDAKTSDLFGAAHA